MIGVDAAEALDATMDAHGIERMTVVRAWNDDKCRYVWTVRVAAPDGLIIESEPHEQLPDAMVDAVRVTAEARRRRPRGPHRLDD